MARYIPDEIEAYSERFTTARFDLFERLGDETKATQTAPQMMVGVVEGAFLSFLVALAQAKRVVEVGTPRPPAGGQPRPRRHRRGDARDRPPLRGGGRRGGPHRVPRRAGP